MYGKAGWFAEVGEGFAGLEIVGWYEEASLSECGLFFFDPGAFFFEEFFYSFVGEAARCTNDYTFFGVDLDTESAAGCADGCCVHS